VRFREVVKGLQKTEKVSDDQRFLVVRTIRERRRREDEDHQRRHVMAMPPSRLWLARPAHGKAVTIMPSSVIMKHYFISDHRDQMSKQRR
jgi:hypothetical protein